MYDLVIENPNVVYMSAIESERLKQRMQKFASLLYEHVTHLSRLWTKELIKTASCHFFRECLIYLALNELAFLVLWAVNRCGVKLQIWRWSMWGHEHDKNCKKYFFVYIL
jgi:hypothetical protein